MDTEDRHFSPRTGGFSDVSPGIRDLSASSSRWVAGPNRPTALREREITALCDSATTGSVPRNSVIAHAAVTQRHRSAFPRRDASGFCKILRPPKIRATVLGV